MIFIELGTKQGLVKCVTVFTPHSPEVASISLDRWVSCLMTHRQGGSTIESGKWSGCPDTQSQGPFCLWLWITAYLWNQWSDLRLLAPPPTSTHAWKWPVPHHMGLSLRLLEHPHNIAAGFPGVWCKRTRKRLPAFHAQPYAITSSTCCGSHSSTLFSVGGEYIA